MPNRDVHVENLGCVFWILNLPPQYSLLLRTIRSYATLYQCRKGEGGAEKYRSTNIWVAFFDEVLDR